MDLLYSKLNMYRTGSTWTKKSMDWLVNSTKIDYPIKEVEVGRFYFFLQRDNIMYTPKSELPDNETGRIISRLLKKTFTGPEEKFIGLVLSKTDKSMLVCNINMINMKDRDKFFGEMDGTLPWRIDIYDFIYKILEAGLENSIMPVFNDNLLKFSLLNDLVHIFSVPDKMFTNMDNSSLLSLKRKNKGLDLLNGIERCRIALRFVEINIKQGYIKDLYNKLNR